jgi:L-seryl-tRNA(Ser) seleniumtransferase
MSPLKSIPKVDKLLALPQLQELVRSYPRPVLLDVVHVVLNDLRSGLRTGALDPLAITDELVAGRVRSALSAADAVSLRRVVNGTGVVIHTNLGRSPLPEAVREGMNDIAFAYSNLEFNLERGERGTRYAHVEELICRLTGAEAALVVNNNAAAVLLALSSLAAGRETVVSRGELVEIGGSFRIPDIMRQSGAHLVEVGTTNRTHPDDYRRAITPETGLLLKVHCSNFAVVGFTAEVAVAGLAEIGREAGLPVMADLGSGNLVDLQRLIGCGEPTVQEYLAAGVDVVTFSGDKLLGGPQTGIIAGKAAYVEPMKKHPLLRALRVDKMTLAALEGTLRLYRDERQAVAEIPTLRMLTATPETLRPKGRSLLRRLRRLVPETVRVALVEGSSQAGGGTLPLLELPTLLVSVAVDGMSPGEVEGRLRRCPVPVIGRIHRGVYLLDLRTILDDDIPALTDGLRSLAD